MEVFIKWATWIECWEGMIPSKAKLCPVVMRRGGSRWAISFPQVSVPLVVGPASWGPFSWFGKLHEISTGGSSRTWLNSRGQPGADSERIPDLWHPLSLWSKEMMGSQKRHLHLTSSQPQEWLIRVMWSKRDWQTLWLKNKRETRLCFVLFGVFSPENPICSHSNQVPLRFGWIRFLRLLQQASEPVRC